MARYVGVDIGLRTAHKAVVLEGEKVQGKPLSVEVSRDGFEELLARATAGRPAEVTFVLDPTGLAWVPLAAYVRAAGHRVHLAKPQKASRLRKFLKEHTKTDTTDAEANARLPLVDPQGVHEWRMPTAEQMTLRRLVKRRDRRMGEVSDQKRRLHALMVMANPALMGALGESAFGVAGQAFLRRYVDPLKVLRAGDRRLQAFWKRHSGGQVNPELLQSISEACRRTVALYQELRRTGQLPFDYEEIQEEVREELDWMQRAQQEADRLGRRIDVLYQRLDPERTLQSVVGIGAVIAPTVEALVGPIDRFGSGRRFVSYCGLCPRKKQSGLRDQPMPITKAGQRLLKKSFYLAAETARQWDAEMAAYYARRWAKGDAHNRIVVALARKIAWRAYAVLKRRERARQVSAGLPVEPVKYVLRHPDSGDPVSKKESRTLILEKYRRQVVNPQRYELERRRAASQGGRKATGPAHQSGRPQTPQAVLPCPPSSSFVARVETLGNLPPNWPADWVSIGEVLRQLLGPAVENLIKTGGQDNEQSTSLPKKT